MVELEQHGSTPVPDGELLSHRIYFEDAARDWVVLVHGAGGSSAIWFRQVRAYREHFNVLLVDLRGHGGSAGLEMRPDLQRYTFEAVSREVLDVLDHLRIETAHFVGISLGCLIIRNIAEVAPHRVRSMVLGGAIVRLDIRSRALVLFGNAFKRVVPFMWLYRIYAWILLPRRGHRESRLIFIREAQKLAQQEFLRWFRLSLDLTGMLRRFDAAPLPVPTLYLMGEEDHMFLPAVQQVAQRDPNALLRVIRKCGHVCNIERPEPFNQLSMQFMLGRL